MGFRGTAVEGPHITLTVFFATGLYITVLATHSMKRSGIPSQTESESMGMLDGLITYHKHTIISTVTATKVAANGSALRMSLDENEVVLSTHPVIECHGDYSLG